MSVHVVKVPDIGEGIAEVELVAWHVAPGDEVAADQVVADLMTDKATVEVPSPVAGRVAGLGGAAGDKLRVGAELIRIEREASGAPATAPSPAAPVVPLAAARTMTTQAGAKPVASPAVRRHARELGIDLESVRGSGPGGRILHEDLAPHARQHGTGSPGPLARRHGEKEVPVIGLRRQIAERMQAAGRIPHFTYVEEVDVTDLEALRLRLNQEHAAARGKLTLLPFLMRAIALAAPDFPQMNARYDDAKGVVTRHAAVHVGMATQTPDGLLVPVVRHAESLDLWACAAEVVRLAEAARSRKATREELSGSTITITSLGPLGGIVSTPILNAPEVAIIGVNRIVERPVLRAGGILPRRLMNLSASFDHRVIDGQEAAEFIQAIRGHLEHPAALVTP